MPFNYRIKRFIEPIPLDDDDQIETHRLFLIPYQGIKKIL